MRPRVLLVIEDGTEYTEAFRRLLTPGQAELVRAGDAEEARRVLEAHRVDGVFLDVVFDRTPPEKLSGDASRPHDQRARQQGFYLVAELAALLARVPRVILSYDFSGEPGRLAALREKVPVLEGVEEGAPLSRIVETLTT